MKREFRTPESLEAERVSRNAVAPFLKSRGFTVQDDHRVKAGTAESQVVSATAPDGTLIKMRVRLCWRWNQKKEALSSAAQLRARLVDDDWDATLNAVVKRDTDENISHALIFQHTGADVALAALIPIDALKPIWNKQRAVSSQLIATGAMGTITKNHATNGTSPTLWLMDKRRPNAHAVSDALWDWPGVEDLAAWPKASPAPATRMIVDDTYDDLLSLAENFDIDPESLGSDGAPRRTIRRSNVQRDRKVRREVVRRATEGCERKSCTDRRRYPGFLDVHHILGAATSDRVWNCVALCPNCHRAAHFGPDWEEVEKELLEYANQFRIKRNGR